MRLELESARFKNFLSFGSRIQEVEFLPGINLVTGLDIDRDKSNGAGKSSFLETIPFALYGQVHRNIRKDQIINWKNKRNCEVSLTFKKNTVVYDILRAIKPNKFEIYKDGNLIDSPAHARDYQLILDDIIGLDFPTFMSLVHSNINSSAKILSMKKGEKRKFLETIFSLSYFTRLNERCNESLRSINEKLREIEITISADQEIIKSCDSTISDMRMRIRKIDIPEQDLKESRIELEDANKDLSNNKDELKNLEADLTHIDSLIILTKDIMNSLKTRTIFSLKMRIKNIDEALEVQSSSDEAQKEYDELVKKFGEFDDVEAKLRKFRREKEDLDGTIHGIDKDISSNKNVIKSFERDLKKEEKLSESLKNKICPTCGQTIEGDNKALSESEARRLSIGLEIERVKYITDKFEKEYKIQSEKCSTKKKIIDKLEKIHTLMWNKRSTIKGVEKETVEKWKFNKERYRRALEKSKGKLDRLSKQLTEYDVRYMQLSGRIEDLKWEVEKVSDLETKIRNLEREIEHAKKSASDYQSVINEQDKKKKEISKRARLLSNKSSKLLELKDYMDYLKWICKDENIKQEAISSNIPFINKKTNEYLSEVNYGFYVVFDKFLEAEIKGPGVTNATYGSLSGGEARGIDIALQLAFLEKSRSQAGIFPDLLTFDELLDSSIDGKGITEIFKILKSKQVEDNSKMFIISHRSEIEGSMNSYHVIKEGGYSRILVND